jgi:hypothetical protein
VNDLSFFYYGIVCVSLAVLGLLLTVLEFRRMSPSKNPIRSDAIIWTTKVHHVNKLERKASAPHYAAVVGATAGEPAPQCIGIIEMGQHHTPEPRIGVP